MTLKHFVHIIGCVMCCKLSVKDISVMGRSSLVVISLFMPHVQRHGASPALTYYTQPVYMHAEHLPIIHHHLQTLLAPSLGKTGAWRLHHPPCHCPAFEQWFWPMALVCYLLHLHFYLTYYVSFPESIAEPTYRDSSCTVIAQASNSMSRCCLFCQAQLRCYKCKAEGL